MSTATPAAPRRGHYRAYASDDVLRLRFIRRAKALGFTLEQIGSLLALSAQRGADMSGLHEAAQSRLAELDARIAELERVRDALRQVVQACPGHGELDACPILSALSQQEQ